MSIAATLGPRLRAYRHVAKARLAPPRRRPPLPRALHFLATWRCNLRCEGCASWRRGPVPELEPAEWAKVFAQLRSLDIVKIIGGEPFVRPDFPEIVQVIRREVNPFIVQVVTNATMGDRVAAFVEQYAWPNLHMRLSLDGGPAAHDKARGVPGTHAKVMATLRNLAGIRKRKRFQLAVNFSMTDDSLPDMAAIVAECRALGVDVVPGFKVKPFQVHCDIAKASMETIGIAHRQAALEELAKTKPGARGGFNWLESKTLDIWNRIVFRKHARGGGHLKFKCGELRHLMYLNPAGELVTCGLNEEPIGNIARDGFEAVWYSARAAQARARVDACPGCMQGAVELMSRLYG